MKLKLRKIDEYELDTGKEKLNLKQWTDYVWTCNNWKIVEIDGKEVVNYCENCHVPLLEDDDYIIDTESICVCRKCYNELE